MNTEHDTFEPLLDVNDVAAMTNFSAHTVRNWVARGDIPYLKVGRGVRFERQAVIDWIQSEKRASRARHPAYQSVVGRACDVPDRWTGQACGEPAGPHTGTCDRHTAAVRELKKGLPR